MFANERNCSSPCRKCLILRNYHAEASDSVSAVVGVSRYILDRHVGLGRFSNVASKQVIYNARDPRPLGIDAPAPQKTGITFGFIGRLDSAKGVERLIDAFTSYACDGVSLVIGGSGEHDYTAQLKGRSEDSRIRFIGRTSPREFYPSIDALIVPSLWNEPLGMVVAEAFAFGKPVIGSKRGGIPEMISHGINGFLYDPDSEDELINSIKLMTEKPEVLSAMSIEAKLSSTQFLDVNAWCSRYLAIYQSLLNCKK